MAELSRWLQEHSEARNPRAIERIRLAMRRLASVLPREIIACQRTLEQKISEGGPKPQRIDPHLLGLAIRELLQERKLIRNGTHAATRSLKWFSYLGTPETEIQQKLGEIAPLYGHVTETNFKNLIGDALEIVVYKSLLQLHVQSPRYTPLGSFDLGGPRANRGRYSKTDPQRNIVGNVTTKVPDFVLTGFDIGPIWIECKNYREWLYPDHKEIHELIAAALDANMTPLLIARRLHYTTIRNLLEPAGILAHESLYQYYPSSQAELAEKIKHVRSLGFFDIRATENPEPRTLKFFLEMLPRVADRAGRKFRQNKTALRDYVEGAINLAQLYNAIGSPAAGNRVDHDPDSEDIS